MNKREKLAYIAGLFDGEGSVGVIKVKATKNEKLYYRIQARISNTDIRPLNFVKSFFGYGCVCLSYRKENHPKARKDCYNYFATGGRGESFIKSIKPYLIIKKDKVREILKNEHKGAVK